MSSPDLLLQSDDELFDPSHRPPYDTIETVPLRRIDAEDDEIESDHETTASLRLPTQTLNTARLTQPTQIIHRSPPLAPSPPSNPVVQVAASSPVPTPTPLRKYPSILASVMAPAGTAFRRPFVPPPPPRQPITIDSDDEGPKYRGDSSDDDRANLSRNNIKTTNFQRKSTESTETVPESPAKGTGLFKSTISSFAYDGTSAGMKRPADMSANAYGGAYKKPRQTGPSRAMPITDKPRPELDMEMDDISDYNTRQKIKRLMSTIPNWTIRDCYDALMEKKGIYDDAAEYLVQKGEKRDVMEKKGNAIDLTGSDDELMPTPAAARKQQLNPVRPQVNLVRQQAKVPQKSITEKWGSTQNAKKPITLHVFDEPPKKSRTLIRGRKDRSSPGPSQKNDVAEKSAQSLSDDSDEADSGIHSGYDDTTLSARVLKFFNTSSAADLMDTAGIKRELAEHIVSQRPFKNMNVVRKVEAPDLKTAKAKRKTLPIGDKVADKVEEMIASYEAVDYLVKKCENIAKPLTAEMKSWGINIYGSQTGELDLISLNDSQMSSHDSGIGTPMSDDDPDSLRRPNPKKFVSPPPTMSDDIRMKEYQIVGLNWLYLLYKKNLSCILADDMGLGKTCQVIAFLAHLLEIGVKGPHLVVVPAATLENWLKEFQKFCPALAVEPYYATNPSEREILRANIEEDRERINVLVTTYTIAKGKDDTPWLRNFGFVCTIFDEGHALKNVESLVYQKLIRIQSDFRLLLTGTPLQNNLKELISLLGFLMPPLFKERQEELQAIFTHHVKALDENHEALLSAQRIARARSMLTPFILRRKKAQVLKELPKKDRRVEYCDMTPEQEEIYQSWVDKAMSIAERRARGEVMGNETANVLMRLRQAAIHPFLFRRIYKDKQLPLIAKQCLKDDLWASSNPALIVTELTEYSDMEIHKLCDDHAILNRFALNNGEWLASGKVQKTLALLREYTAQGHRTLIFSQFTMVLDILELILEREAIAYFRLDGNTKVSERQDLIDEFCDEDNHTPVFMLSTRAGGAGINLAKANKVIVFDSGFNPQDDVQAENRAHRIGQVKEVEVVRLVSRGTVEEQIYAMGLTKLKLDEQVAGDAGSEEDANGSGKKEGELSEREMEGRNIVEEMFFKALEGKTMDDKKQEAVEVLGAKEADADVPQDSDSQKTIKPEKSSQRKIDALFKSQSQAASQHQSQATNIERNAHNDLKEEVEDQPSKQKLSGIQPACSEDDEEQEKGLAKGSDRANVDLPSRPRRERKPATVTKTRR